MMLNALKPSVREKKRYLCFKVGQKISAEEVQKEILSRVKKWIGEKEFALGRVHFMKKYFSSSENSSKGIISCNNKQYLNVKAGMMLTEAFSVSVFYVSGTLRKAKEMLDTEDKNIKNKNKKAIKNREEE